MIFCYLICFQCQESLGGTSTAPPRTTPKPLRSIKTNKLRGFSPKTSEDVCVNRHDWHFSIARNNREVWNLAGQNRERVTLRSHRSFFRMLRTTMAMPVSAHVTFSSLLRQFAGAGIMSFLGQRRQAIDGICNCRNDPIPLNPNKWKPWGTGPFGCSIDQVFSKLYILDELDVGVEMKRRREDPVKRASFGELLLTA